MFDKQKFVFYNIWYIKKGKVMSMKRKIVKENPNGEIIMKLYYLCSSSMDQMQGLLDEQLEVTKIVDKEYHFSYLQTEFDFSIYKTRKEIQKEELWILQAAKKFL